MTFKNKLFSITLCLVSGVVFGVSIPGTSFADNQVTNNSIIQTNTHKASFSQLVLPLGSVISLKGAQKNAYLMIVNRLPVVIRGKRKGYYEYGGVPAYQGSTSKYYYFNTSDIKKILFVGYRNQVEINYAKELQQSAKTTKVPHWVRK